MGEAVTEPDRVLDALCTIDKAVRSLYTAHPALAQFPEMVAEMLRDVAIEQSVSAIRHELLMRQIANMKVRRALAEAGKEVGRG